MANSKPYRLSFKLALVLIAGGFSVAVCELLLALVPGLDSDYYPSRYIRLRERAPSREMFWRASDAVLDYEDGLETTEFRLATDAEGFVLPSVACPDPEQVLVFLGGSTTECANVQETNRFPYVVSQHLNRNGCRVRTYNGAAIGNHSMHSLNILLNKVLPLKPDFVVLMHNVNDLGILLVSGGYHSDHPSRSLIVTERSGFTFHLKGVIKNLLPQVYHVSRLGLKSLSGDSDEFRQFRGKQIDVDEVRVAEQFRRSLGTFVAVCNANRIRPILMTQANRFTESPQGATASCW